MTNRHFLKLLRTYLTFALIKKTNVSITTDFMLNCFVLAKYIIPTYVRCSHARSRKSLFFSNSVNRKGFGVHIRWEKRNRKTARFNLQVQTCSHGPKQQEY